MSSLRKKHSGIFKSKVVIATLNNNKTINEIGKIYGVHPNQISNWKKIALDGMPTILSDKRSQKERNLNKLDTNKKRWWSKACILDIIFSTEETEFCLGTKSKVFETQTKHQKLKKTG